MNRRSALIAAAAAFFMASCGPSGPPPPPPWSPVGTFSFTTVVPDIGTVDGSITITGADGTYAGTVDASAAGLPPLAITGIDVGDMMISVQADFQGEVLFMEMNFTTDDDYTGFWSVAGESGDISGSRVVM